MFPLFSALSIIPTLLLILAKGSYWALVLVGFVLGIGGTTFAIGIPHVNAWFPASRHYSIGLMLLSDLAFAAALHSITRMRERSA